MSILTSASSNSVSRGFDYYNDDKVINITQLNNEEYEGFVQGNSVKPYYVKINTKYPRKSFCECPHATGNITCKHMVSLYFTLFNEEAEDYEKWLESDYEDYEEDDYYENYNYDQYPTKKFNKPIFFDLALEDFVDNLNVQKLKEILKEQLKKDEEFTYQQYLSKSYNRYFDTNYEFLEKLKERVITLTDIYNYNYNDYEQEILSFKDRKKIKDLYQNENLKQVIDDILFTPELAVYADYKWIIKFFKINKPLDQLDVFNYKLENFLNNLKHYSIKNNLPKSNVLITMYLLNDYTIKEKATLLLANAKYHEFVDYVINDQPNERLKLYNEILKEVDHNYLKVKRYLPGLLYKFLGQFEDTNEENDSDIYYYSLYKFLCEGNVQSLKLLEHLTAKETILNEIENRTKDIYVLINLYVHFNEQDKLWELLNKTNNKEHLLKYIDFLKDKYNDELYIYFKHQFYDTLKIAKKREIYEKAGVYIKAIRKLNNGSKYIKDILTELNNSEYQKCYILFEIINNEKS